MINLVDSFGKSQMNARLQRLHKIYGPFVRFSPEGNEGEGDNAVDKAIEEAEKAETAKFDKVRQQADQEKANATRARDEASRATASLETANSENASLREQLKEAESKATRRDLKVKELDVENSDNPELAQTINDLREGLASSNDEIKNLKKAESKFRSDAENDQRQQNANNAKNAAYNELLSDLDADYGADLRNSAVSKFQDLAKAGKVPQGSPAKAARLMEKCYKEAESDKKKTNNDPLKLDTGSGGGNGPLKGHKLKSGSLDDVMAQVNSALG